MTDRNSTTQIPSKQAKRKRITTEEFIRRSKDRHGDRFTYENTIYEKYSANIRVRCKYHGDIIVPVKAQLESNGCPECVFDNHPQRLSTKEFVNRSIGIHKGVYNYDLVDYKNKSTPVEIFCKSHGVFKQKPEVHLRGGGCPRCKGVASLTLDDFIKRSELLHGDKYDYSITEFKSTKKPVSIICRKHGKFTQRAQLHLIGHGCVSCADYGGFKRDEFVRVCSNKNNGMGTLYVLELCNENEVFFKVGITSRLIGVRFASLKKYSYKVVCEIVSDPVFTYELERRLHDVLSDYKYEPLIKFAGHTECFTTINPIKKLLKRLSTTDQLQLLA